MSLLLRNCGLVGAHANSRVLPTVKLQWLREPPAEAAASVGAELKLECLATGEPKPVMRWEKLASFSSSQTKQSGELPPARSLAPLRTPSR